MADYRSKRPPATYPDIPIDPERQIRILSLLPGEWDDPVCCELSVRVLESKQASCLDRRCECLALLPRPLVYEYPEETESNFLSPSEVPSPQSNSLSKKDLQCYSALSYVWGSWDDYGVVVLNDESDFPVTRNLYAALRRIRRRYQKRRLWVDQICINQESNEERGHQVRIMGQVYSHASEVIVWLGEMPDRVDLDHTVRWINDGSTLRVDKSSQLWAMVAHRKATDIVNVLVRHVINESQMPWHTRAWVIQEVVLAPLSLSAYFGPCQVQWEDALALGNPRYQQIDLVRKQHRDALRTAQRRLGGSQRGRTSASVSNTTLIDFAATISTTECGDPRDKIYSLLALISAKERDLIDVDYNKPISHVYAEATYANIIATSAFSIMALIRSNHKLHSEERIPSWVPDFRVVAIQERGFHDLQVRTGVFSRAKRIWFRNAKAPGPADKIAFQPQSQMLSIKAFKFDKLASAFELSHDDPEPLQEDAVLQDWIDKLKVSLPDTNPFERLLSWRDGVRNFGGPPEPYVAGAFIQDDFLRLINLWERKSPGRKRRRTREGSPVELAWRRYFDVLTEQPMLFTTSLGFIGLGPSNIATNDVVILPQGSTIPMLLRLGNGCWQFTSFVYLSGIMNGELHTIVPDLTLDEDTFVLV